MAQTVELPTIGVIAGDALTVIVVFAVLGQFKGPPPPPAEYSIFTVPAATPVTTPVVLSTLAIVGSLLFHLPPVVASVTVIVLPVHTAVGPPITGRAAPAAITLIF